MPDAERTAYHRELYGKSTRHRLARINHTRRRRGMPEVQFLDDVKIRNPW